MAVLAAGDSFPDPCCPVTEDGSGGRRHPKGMPNAGKACTLNLPARAKNFAYVGNCQKQGISAYVPC
jgi:hypothetical protein